jgi:hypothetical protein
VRPRPVNYSFDTQKNAYVPVGKSHGVIRTRLYSSPDSWNPSSQPQGTRGTCSPQAARKTTPEFVRDAHICSRSSGNPTHPTRPAALAVLRSTFGVPSLRRRLQNTHTVSTCSYPPPTTVLSQLSVSCLLTECTLCEIVGEHRGTVGTGEDADVGAWALGKSRLTHDPILLLAVNIQ